MASPNQLSFLPDDYLERKAQRRTNAICAVLFLVVMVAIGSAFSFTERSMRDLDREYAQVEQEYTDAAKRIQLVQQMQDKQRRMAQQAELAASLLEKVPRSFLLAELTNALPAGVSLLDLAMESKVRAAPSAAATPKATFEQKRDQNKKPEPAAPTPKVYDVSMRICGVAYTDVQVSQFITRLNRSKLLKDVNLVISDEYKQVDEQLRKFQIEATLNPSAEIDTANAKPKTVTAEIGVKESQP